MVRSGVGLGFDLVLGLGSGCVWVGLGFFGCFGFDWYGVVGSRGGLAVRCLVSVLAVGVRSGWGLSVVSGFLAASVLTVVWCGPGLCEVRFGGVGLGFGCGWGSGLGSGSGLGFFWLFRF